MIRPALVVLALAIACQGASAQDEAVGLLEAADAARLANDAERAVDLYRAALEVDAAAGYGIAFVGSGRCVGITEAAIAGLRRLSPEGARLYRTRNDARAVAAFARARRVADPYRALALVYERHPIATVAPSVLELMGDLAFERGHTRRAQDAFERLLEHHVVDGDAARVRAKLAASTPTPGSERAPTIGGLRFTKAFAASAPRPNRFAPRSAPPPAQALAPCLPRIVGGRAFVVTPDAVLAHDLRSGEDGRAITRLGPTHAEENVKVLFGAAVDEATLVVPFVDRIVHERMFRWSRPRATPIRKLAGFDLEGWRWTWNHARLLDGTPLATWSFPSPPVAVDGVVFASAFEDGPTSGIFVAAFDARTGARLWDQRVGSGVVEMTFEGERATEALCTPVAVWGGLVFHSTAFGWVSALDAMSGRPVWTSEYEVNETRTPPGFHPASLTLDWECNAPVVQSGVLLVAPMDSPRFYGFDARTGERLWSHRQHLRSAFEREKLMRVVVGTGEASGQGVVVIGGGTEVRCLAVRTGKLLWSAQLRGRTVAGRGCVSGGVVLVPVDRGEVFTLDLATGKRLGAFPVGATGNVTLAGEHVLVTGNGVLAVHAAGP